MDFTYLYRNRKECDDCKNAKCKNYGLLSIKISVEHECTFFDSGYGEDDEYSDMEYTLLYRFCPKNRSERDLFLIDSKTKCKYNKYGEIIKDENINR